ncbi:unnamed protein product [Spirodela intermedia]|uniref:Uncharacterized protein n=1 Tax=Spirodela intermedia TaxID=51605 RepID=A0A7I8JJH9_SPIIN|nr:unnamed protein product [Spirodela intermedia]CAA6669582.1 unnamed protein product [Spirodela intermedia]
MTKYNVVTKAKRAEIQERKRALRGEPGTGKLKQKQDNYIQSLASASASWSINGDQKEALQKGLISMEDVEMAVAEERAKLRIKNSKSKVFSGSRLSLLLWVLLGSSQRPSPPTPLRPV